MLKDVESLGILFKRKLTRDVREFINKIISLTKIRVSKTFCTITINIVIDNKIKRNCTVKYLRSSCVNSTVYWEMSLFKQKSLLILKVLPPLQWRWQGRVLSRARTFLALSGLNGFLIVDHTVTRISYRLTRSRDKGWITHHDNDCLLQKWYNYVAVTFLSRHKIPSLDMII